MARYRATPLALDTSYYVTSVYDAKAKTMDVYLNGEFDNDVLVGPVMGIEKSSRKRICIGRRGGCRSIHGRDRRCAHLLAAADAGRDRG